jgi:hypothetical protein
MPSIKFFVTFLEFVFLALSLYVTWWQMFRHRHTPWKLRPRARNFLIVFFLAWVGVNICELMLSNDNRLSRGFTALWFLIIAVSLTQKAALRRWKNHGQRAHAKVELT